jgi:hypothetical protein
MWRGTMVEGGGWRNRSVAWRGTTMRTQQGDERSNKRVVEVGMDTVMRHGSTRAAGRREAGMDDVARHNGGRRRAEE